MEWQRRRMKWELKNRSIIPSFPPSFLSLRSQGGRGDALLRTRLIWEDRKERGITPHCMLRALPRGVSTHAEENSSEGTGRFPALGK